jgi:hypothetical protein
MLHVRGVKERYRVSPRLAGSLKVVEEREGREERDPDDVGLSVDDGDEGALEDDTAVRYGGERAGRRAATRAAVCRLLASRSAWVETTQKSEGRSV